MIFVDKNNPLHPDNYFALFPRIEKGLYMEGMIKPEDKNAVAIVGTRKPSIYGIEMARNISKKAVEQGFTVVSGLARGIDTEAHRAAINNGGRTIAVLGTGINIIYPEENVALANDISKNGAVLSQFPPDTPPIRRNFPLRNAVVAHLSKILILVEAPERSGSLITARLAAEAGRLVFVVSGKADEKSFEGNFAFLKKFKNNANVKLLSSVDDIFGDFVSDMAGDIGGGAQERMTVKEPSGLTGEEKAVFDALNPVSDGLLFDELVMASGLGPEILPSVLLTLILKNTVEERSGNIFTLIRG